jgi:hypothetical protein
MGLLRIAIVSHPKVMVASRSSRHEDYSRVYLGTASAAKLLSDKYDQNRTRMNVSQNVLD